MRPEELMIGDLVQLSSYQGRVNGIIRLREVHTAEEKWMTIIHFGDNYYEQMRVDILEPIPLTPEILEKNGFKHLDISSTEDTINRFVWRYSTDSQNIDLSYNKFTKDYMLDSFRIHMFPIIYVHELQHALRMGGIEKEIEL